MQLTCKLGTHNKRIVNVYPSQQLNILLNLLNITDKKTKFLFNGETFNMASILTFEEIGLTSNQTIFINNQAIAGSHK